MINFKYLFYATLLIAVCFGMPEKLFSQSQNSKIIKVGVYDNPPNIYLNEKGEPDGFFIDILEVIAERENLKIKYEFNTWSNQYEKLKKGEIDILPNMIYSAERDSIFNLSKLPILTSWLELFSRSDSNINTITDIKHKKIGVIKGTIYESKIKEFLARESIDDFIIMEYDNYTAFTQALKKREVDVIVADRFLAYSNLFDESIKATGIIVVSSRLDFAFTKSKSTVLATLFDKNTALLKSDPDSEYYKSLFVWLDKGSKNSMPDYLIWLFAVFILGWIGTIAFILLLQKKVKAKTIELMIAKEKAEESDLLKSAFLANMSHEIRTPMNGILGFAELLKEPNLNGKKKLKYIRIIERSGVRMLNIINDIINISKIESGQMEVLIQKSNINEQLEYLFTFFLPEAEKKEIQLSHNSALPLNQAFIMTDREKVFAILTNLVKNAINHTEKGKVEFGYVINNKFIEFYVKDTGIGVPKDRQEAIFERFVQADIAKTMAKQGAGLGLSISKAYVEMLGGKLWLVSEEGIGSEFYFTLPFVLEENIEQGADLKIRTLLPVSPKEKLRILVAEDDAISKLLISKIVKDFAQEVFYANNGKEAVAICRDKPDIDLVLMDIQMPEMDGYTATREIRKFNKEVIIIAQSANALSDDRDKAITAGCDDFIAKPIKINELKGVVFKYFQ